MTLSDFLDLMPHTVTVYSRSAFDNYGMESYATGGVSYRCRIEGSTSRMVSADGREISPSYVLYIDSAHALIPVDSKIVIDGVEYQAAKVVTEEDETGPHHQVLYLE